MMDPADLNDPAKAEAFLRETIAGLRNDIAKTEIDIAEEIRRFSEDNADDPEAVLKYTRGMQEVCKMRLGFLRKDLERLTKLMASLYALVQPSPIILDAERNGHDTD